MKFSLIVCTYKRAEAIDNLMKSVKLQKSYPDEIIIVDGSPDHETKEYFEQNSYQNLQYFLVSPEQRGLTKQRNFGIAQVSDETAVVCFLDDDVVLEPEYFEEILKTYQLYPEALGVGGYITNEVVWEEANKKNNCIIYFKYDGFVRKEDKRNVLRNQLGFKSNKPPGFMPEFGHGRSISYLPPSGKIYPVEFFMGGVASYKKEVFEKIKFSTFFEGYGLYEDADFTLRLSKIGQLYVNTQARLAHYHNPTGRPNMYKYGKMVVRNGWYVWRVKNPKPSFYNIIKWHSLTWFLMLIRLLNVFTTTKRKTSLNEFLGRFSGWIKLFFEKNKIEN